jgi:hypothetical protein
LKLAIVQGVSRSRSLGGASRTSSADYLDLSYSVWSLANLGDGCLKCRTTIMSFPRDIE